MKVDLERDRQITDILSRLEVIWKKCSCLRLGQLIGNVYHSTDKGGVTQYYKSDDAFIKEIEAVYRPEKKRNGKKTQRATCL